MADTNWVRVYDLHDDEERIKGTQFAALNYDNAGMKPTHGLFGSPQWWDAIERGEIAKMLQEGVISKVYVVGQTDYPLFDVKSGRSKMTWDRLGFEEQCIVGRKARITYVMQELKWSPPSEPSRRVFSPVALTIELEGSLSSGSPGRSLVHLELVTA